MEPFPLPIPGETVAGHRIVRMVGEGADGVVYAALGADERDYALKILRPEKADDPDAVRAFADEAEATGAVRQKNVVRIYDHGRADGFHYILMELVDGPPLSRILAETGKIGWRDGAKTVIQVARALHCAHGLGFLHRDVKPENILLFRDGRARLTDFGIVKDISSLKGYLLPGRRVGTAPYASPEQCLGKRLSQATDVYSLGATYYHMLCGRPPFTAETPSKVMVMHVKAPLVPPAEVEPSVPRSVSKLVGRMLAKRQGARPDISHVIDDLICLVKGKVPVGRRPTAKRGLRPPGGSGG